MMSNVMGVDLLSRAYFPKDVHVVEIPARRKGGTIDITTEEISNGGYAIPTAVSQAIRRASQLGLKEVWLGGAPGDHNRWDHSVGTFNVGLFWLKTLEEDHRVPAHCLETPLSSWNRLRAMLGTALLLHDYGHLPFAHMMEEVLRSINWLPSAREPGLEAAVLRHRFEEPVLVGTWQSVLNSATGPDVASPINSLQIRTIIEQLIQGSHAVPWLQTIVNSPVDADKIDYLRFDSEFIKDKAFPVRHRLLQDKPTQWLADFLSDQDVNHAGLLCLHGRSAVAAADLWRERIFFYDRLYLAPELRVPERMALEIVQQFVIRSVMSPGFLERAGIPRVRGFSNSLQALNLKASCSADGLIRLKYGIVRDAMIALLDMIEGETLELGLLKRMMHLLGETPSIDSGCKEFLSAGFNELMSLNTTDPSQRGTCRLRDVVNRCLVREPITIARESFDDAVEALRPLQHVYSREMLIDVARLPAVLSGLRRRKAGTKNEDNVDYSILVPSGPVETWAPGVKAKLPLCDSVVKHLERPYCRVIIIAPGVANSARGAYLWDRTRTTLIEAGIEPLEKGVD